MSNNRTGIELIAQERQEQIEKHGRTMGIIKSNRMRTLLYHLLSFMICVTTGFLFAICVLWASVNVANQILNTKP